MSRQTTEMRKERPDENIDSAAIRSIPRQWEEHVRDYFDSHKTVDEPIIELKPETRQFWVRNIRPIPVIESDPLHSLRTLASDIFRHLQGQNIWHAFIGRDIHSYCHSAGVPVSYQNPFDNGALQLYGIVIRTKKTAQGLCMEEMLCLPVPINPNLVPQASFPDDKTVLERANRSLPDSLSGQKIWHVKYKGDGFIHGKRGFERVRVYTAVNRVDYPTKGFHVYARGNGTVIIRDPIILT